MPFSIELYGTKIDRDCSIHLIIDRKNVIIAVSKSNSEQLELKPTDHLNKIREIRLAIGAVIGKNRALTPFRSSDPNFSGTDDPRHDALVHVGDYDRKGCVHYHHIFNQDVNFTIIDILLKQTDFSSISHLVCNESVQAAWDAAKQYFLELDTRAEVKVIEGNYRLQKDQEFRLAEKQVKSPQQHQGINSQPISSMAIILSELFTLASSFGDLRGQGGLIDLSVYAAPIQLRPDLRIELMDDKSDDELELKLEFDPFKEVLGFNSAHRVSRATEFPVAKAKHVFFYHNTWSYLETRHEATKITKDALNRADEMQRRFGK